MKTHVTLTVPDKFWNDHSDRDCVLDPEWIDGVIWSDGTVTLELSAADVWELLSDAEHYAHTSEYSIGLRGSAHATVRAIHAQLDDQSISYCRVAYDNHAANSGAQS